MPGHQGSAVFYDPDGEPLDSVPFEYEGTYPLPEAQLDRSIRYLKSESADGVTTIRQAWLNGPTPEEREAYALRLRQRRLADTFDEGEAMLTDSVRRGMRLGREGQLAADGAPGICTIASIAIFTRST